MLSGRTTAIAGSLRDYRADDGVVPEIGELGIVVDGRGTPAALVVVTEVLTVPYAEVDPATTVVEGVGLRPRHRDGRAAAAGALLRLSPPGADRRAPLG